jgi:copper(I)-binding protein
MKRLTLLSVLLLAVAAAPAAKLQVSDPWVRESNPARNITSGFMTLTNPTGNAMTIVAVASPAAKIVEMHEMKTIEGMMSMRRTEKIVIPPRGTVKLEPGGMHLMLIDLVRPVKDGEEVTFVLTLEGGTKVAVKAAVKNPDAAGHAHAH